MLLARFSTTSALILLIALGHAKAQTCDGVFMTQTEVDSFSVQNPGCHVLEDLIIYSSPDDPITNLDGLASVTAIQGLAINVSDDIADFSGLDNIEYIGELDYAEDWVSDGRFEAFKGLKVLGSTLKLYDLGCDSITGFGNLELIEGDLQIDWNQELKHVGHLGDELTIRSLIIEDNSSLSDISFVNAITSMEGRISFVGNHQLEICNYPIICRLLPSSLTTIRNNGRGCNTVDEVARGCPFEPSITMVGDGYCSTIENIHIANHTSGTDGVLDIYDQSGGILCSVNPRGNQLRNTSFKVYRNTQALQATPPYSSRMITIDAEMQPLGEVSVHLYYSKEEVEMLLAADENIEIIDDLRISISPANCPDTGTSISVTHTPFEWELIGQDSIYAFNISTGIVGTFYLHGPGDLVLSMDEIDSPQVQIYPNPASDVLYWQSDISAASLSLVDIHGRQVLDYTSEKVIDLSPIPAGTYVARIVSQGLQIQDSQLIVIIK